MFIPVPRSSSCNNPSSLPTDALQPGLFGGGWEQVPADPSVRLVADWVKGEAHRQGKPLSGLFATSIRRAIDEVIDGPRTGRWAISQLEKTEKTYIGTKIEIVVRASLNLERQKPLDTWIAGVPVDIKWSERCAWEIPGEAVGQVCLVLGLERKGAYFCVGVMRTCIECLSLGKNKDGKRKLSAVGRQSICWLVRGERLPPNFIADLPEPIRSRIMSPKNGQARIRELVQLVQERPIPRIAIETVAQQRDPMRRVRADQGERLGGVVVLSGRYGNRVVGQLGLPPLGRDEFISVPKARLAAANLGIYDKP